MNAKILVSAVVFSIPVFCFGAASATNYAPTAQIIYPQAPSAPQAQTFIPHVNAISHPTFKPYVQELPPAHRVPLPMIAPTASTFQPQVSEPPLASEPPPAVTAERAQRFTPQPEQAPKDVEFLP